MNKAAANLNINIFQFCTAMLALLMMTAKSMLSKHPVSRIAVTLFFPLSYFRPILIYCIPNILSTETDGDCEERYRLQPGVEPVT